ncbi:MAG: hypothetical protein ABL982_03200 [Vicinamibacterales bacterium]
MPTDIHTLVNDFTTQLEQMIRRTALEQVEAALGGAAAPARQGPGRPRKTAGSAPVRRAPKGGKRSSASMDQMQATLLAHVKANPGQRGEQIAAALKTDVGTMRLPMKKLIAARAVRTEGQRRGMTYFAAGAGGGGPAKAKVGNGKKKRAKRGARKAKASGPKALVVEVAAAA